MAAELGDDPTGVHRGCPDAAPAQPAVQLHREQGVGRLRPPVCNPLVVGALLETGIIQAHITEAVPGRGQHDHTRRLPVDHERRQPIHQHEVAEVVGAELHLEAVAGGGLGARHDPGVGDQHVDAVVPVSDELVCEGPDRLERGEVCPVQLDVLRSGLVQSGPRPVEVADHTGDRSSVSRERTGGLHTETGRGTGDHHPDPGQVETCEHVVGGRIESGGGHHRMLPGPGKSRHQNRASAAAHRCRVILEQSGGLLQSDMSPMVRGRSAGLQRRGRHRGCPPSGQRGRVRRP